ncbi:hypothetical protein BTVI_28035 [Pitangus sulphuratus]|nr:hypothetical protein BTVI_28035 [Pitangus sulphuratus]
MHLSLQLKTLQKAWIWTGFVTPVDTMIIQLYPTQSPPRPGRLARKRRGRLERLLLSVVPTSIQNILGYLPADWGQGNQPREILEALINPFNKASKRKRDDVALEEQESWFVVLERDLPEDDSEDLTYEPSDEESDSEEYKSHNDTEAELEEQDGITVLLKESSCPQSPAPLPNVGYSHHSSTEGQALGTTQTHPCPFQPSNN